jgi:hypothetical protein
MTAPVKSDVTTAMGRLLMATSQHCHMKSWNLESLRGGRKKFTKVQKVMMLISPR